MCYVDGKISNVTVITVQATVYNSSGWITEANAAPESVQTTMQIYAELGVGIQVKAPINHQCNPKP